MRQRLDQLVYRKGLALSRHQAVSWIRLGRVTVQGRVVSNPQQYVTDDALIALHAEGQYVGRAGLKLASVAEVLGLHFADAVVLDVGSSTGGFTDYALQHGAKKVIAVDAGKDQLHLRLRQHPRIESYEQTDIRDLRTLPVVPDIVVIDVSFISLRDILPHVAKLTGSHTRIVAMVKPQFEAAAAQFKHRGVIKNDRMRRDILKSFEDWARQHFIIVSKADSMVAGTKGNLERFYCLMQLKASATEGKP